MKSLPLVWRQLDGGVRGPPVALQPGRETEPGVEVADQVQPGGVVVAQVGMAAERRLQELDLLGQTAGRRPFVGSRGRGPRCGGADGPQALQDAGDDREALQQLPVEGFEWLLRPQGELGEGGGGARQQGDRNRPERDVDVGLRLQGVIEDRVGEEQQWDQHGPGDPAVEQHQGDHDRHPGNQEPGLVAEQGDAQNTEDHHHEGAPHQVQHGLERGRGDDPGPQGDDDGEIQRDQHRGLQGHGHQADQHQGDEEAQRGALPGRRQGQFGLEEGGEG